MEHSPPHGIGTAAFVGLIKPLFPRLVHVLVASLRELTPLTLNSNTHKSFLAASKMTKTQSIDLVNFLK